MMFATSSLFATSCIYQGRWTRSMLWLDLKHTPVKNCAADIEEKGPIELFTRLWNGKTKRALHRSTCWMALRRIRCTFYCSRNSFGLTVNLYLELHLLCVRSRNALDNRICCTFMWGNIFPFVVANVCIISNSNVRRQIQGRIDVGWEGVKC